MVDTVLLYGNCYQYHPHIHYTENKTGLKRLNNVSFRGIVYLFANI